MTDRRRINGPPGGTTAPVFASAFQDVERLTATRPLRRRAADEMRKIFLKTGVTPSASGSAYYEIQSSAPPSSPAAAAAKSLVPQTSSLKLSCSVHGPRPLPRSAPFSSHLVLTATVKFAPFATRRRRGYVRDATERDLGAHLETALRGIVIGERWPKSGVDVIITVLEGEEDGWFGDEVLLGGGDGGSGVGWGLMTTLAGCITVACAAIVEAGIDCVDLVSGGIAAVVRDGKAGKRTAKLMRPEQEQEQEQDEEGQLVLDPCPSEHREIVAACVVGYLASRDEITELWTKGRAGPAGEELIDQAVKAAIATRTVLSATLREAAHAASRGPEVT